MDSLRSAQRKTRSASINSSQQRDADDDRKGSNSVRRPVTVEARLPSRSSGKSTPVTCKRPSMASESIVAELLIGGWGDFDADQLLHEDSGALDAETLMVFSPVSPVHEGGPEEPQEAAVASPGPQVTDRTGRKRNSVPLIVLPREGSSHSPGFPSLSRSIKMDTPSSRSRPPTQVLRQRVLEVEDFAAGSSSASASPTTGGLRKRLPRLPSHSGGGPESCAADTAPLFGVFVADTMEMRATIFAHFRRLWQLMSSRPASRENSRQAEELKSPFECSMALLKLCKAVGISLPPNAALSSTVPFWYGKSRDVEFTDFCEYVVRHAIQPAVEHFKLDGTMDEYVACIHAIVQSLLFTLSEDNNEGSGKGDSSSARLRELSEIQPVFPSWTAGIAPLAKDKRAKNDPEQQTEAAATSEPAAYALRREAGMRLRLADQAKATHEANIQRKVRLHKSWQPRAVGTPGLVVSDDRPVSIHDRQANDSCVDGPSPQRIDGRHLDARALERVNSAPPVVSSEPVEPDEPPNQGSDDLLLCGVCTARDAMLWCSSCFAVYCIGCWQDVHHTFADISHVPNTSSSLPDQLQGPLSRQLKKHENDVVPPPVAMLYLPVKPLQSGKRIKGVQYAHAKAQQSSEKPFGSRCAAVSAVNEATTGIAHALLPALSRASLANDGFDHHHDTPHTDSAADLLKKLVQSAASNYSTGASGTTRQYKDPKKRTKLHPAAVTLDASSLFGPES